VHAAFVVRGIIMPVLGYVFFFWIVPGIIGLQQQAMSGAARR
jgi:hypothetical protein